MVVHLTSLSTGAGGGGSTGRIDDVMDEVREEEADEATVMDGWGSGDVDPS
jgi:hypothetical protein